MKISHMTTTNTLGPGKRFVIWMQGCKKNCVGCINPEGRNLDGGYKITVEDIMERLSKHPDLVGVTISGGEPFLQFDELQKLIQRIKQETMLDIMLYSGYTLEHLKQMIPDSMKFFENIDIFVDGEYIQGKNENEMYRGSSNQKIYFFTDRYKAWQEKIMQSKSRNFSFEVKENGEVLFVGIPPKGFYEKFLEKIGGYNDERKKSI